MTQIWSELRRGESTWMSFKNHIPAAFQIYENPEVLGIEEI